MFDPLLADIRFGCGRSPRIAAPDSVEAMLAGLLGPDTAAAAHPIETYEIFLASRLTPMNALGRIRRQERGTALAEEALESIIKLNREGRKARLDWLVAHVARRITSETPLRERLESFWGDHFSARGKVNVLRISTSPYLESAIRPYLAGRFEDMLIAAVTHPQMLHSLDQHASAGPNSPQALRYPGRKGMNENLARELLELHTLGVGGPYTQGDVYELAKLLTGLAFTAEAGTEFRAALAEPGAETVLGTSYGGAQPALEDIHAVLRDLARHPATARHIAHKLAVHFIGDHPDTALVAAMAEVWWQTGGDLPQVYHAMLSHPAAWDPAPGNAKPPLDFIASACRALDVPPKALAARAGLLLMNPLRQMGQVWQEPLGPDGLPEADGAWLTPQGLAARLQWGFTLPQLMLDRLPDPRDFVVTALGARAPEEVRFAASAAETRSDGIGVVLASPAFQRM
ncbi:DUF1800 domain-containing protein [Antarctobacter heliothermus]|uniref:Uncharacterized conserved protein, DUF1800 family n=1 Tax=Antarctobacter heliothermus TaxID=74033 RepID=A0A239KKR2_9RHOB|nr:DUF1800 domain-containing protein [Antarctobacter heliothermus]SNT18751.1 Uncharacterized conserved protein, DUF1800 family [Antarctobacter heliothermus]